MSSWLRFSLKLISLPQNFNRLRSSPTFDRSILSQKTFLQATSYTNLLSLVYLDLRPQVLIDALLFQVGIINIPKHLWHNINALDLTYILHTLDLWHNT